MSFPSIKEVVERYSLTANKDFGQNFLYDLDLTAKIVQAAGNISDKIILEIGPGVGSLSRPILSQNIKTLTSLEIDQRCIKALSYLTKFYAAKFNLINTDALKFRIKDHFNEKIIIIANLPYNISTQLFFNWVDEVESIEKMVLMFQKEVALRLLAKPSTNNYGKLSIIADLFFDRSHYMDLNPEFFFPSPKVVSSVLVFTPNRDKHKFDYKKIKHLLTISFGQKRKMLKNNLIKLIPDIEQIMREHGINQNARPEELSTSDYINLSHHI